MPPTTAPTTAKISWVDGALLVAEGGSGHTLTMDGAPDIGGRNLASRPMEVVLMGMGGCTAIDVVAMLVVRMLLSNWIGTPLQRSARRRVRNPKLQ